MSRKPNRTDDPDRRDFLKTAGAAAAGAFFLPSLDTSPWLPMLGGPTSAIMAPAGFAVQPFALTQVKLAPSIFTQKRDRILAYARGYGGADVTGGPDRILSIFRANAGLDTKGAQPVGDWENGTGYLRGHFAGHFMTMLAQAYAGTGDPIFKQKLDYIVAGLAECQDALARAAALPTPRVNGRFGRALRLTGSPIGLAEHVSMPAGIVNGLRDFTIALWINPAVYERNRLSDQRPTVDLAALTNGTAIFDFGSPNAQYAEPALARMYLTIRASNDVPVPRFAITTSGSTGEQHVDAPRALPVDTWTHVAITRAGSTVTMYFDGEPVASNTNVTISPADLGETTGNCLGRQQFPQRNVSYLNAQLDEFQVFDRGLAPDQVRALMTDAGGTVQGGNVLWYRFDEANGARVEDSSGRGHHGTVIAPTDGRRHPGFLSAYPETQFMRLEEFATYGGNQGIWAPYYTLHKILAGLVAANTATGNTQALDIASKIGDWTYGRLSKLRPEQFDRMWNMYIAGEYGGANDAFASLYALRQDKPEYLTIARYFDNRNVKDPVAQGNDILDGRHANQHIPQFTGYLRVYETSGESEYYTAAKNFWDMVVPHRVYSHGGVGVGEILRKRDVIAGSLYSEPKNHDHAETCVVYNMLKLSRNLFFHDADAKYMNYYEQVLYNQVLASRRDIDSVESPEVTYFVPVRPGERRQYGNEGTCCGGTGLENHTKYQDSIYFRSTDGQTLFVNLYIPSVLSWEERGFTIEQVSQLPEAGASALTIRGSGRLRLKLRVPTWAARFSVAVNGTSQHVTVVPGQYVTIDRDWRSGDRIAISMPMSFRTERTIDRADVQSIFYGPTLLAVQSPAVGDTLEAGLIPVSLYKHYRLTGDFRSAMKPIGGKPLHFDFDGHTWAPFFVSDPQAGDTQPYHMYVRRHEPTIVFGANDSGVANTAREDGMTFLDALWAGAPFRDRAHMVAAAEQLSRTWRSAGRMGESEQRAIVRAARQMATE
ncbi:MAG: glycoside hydrolase family 127 protein [Gemmatimonadaceae bacterium]